MYPFERFTEKAKQVLTFAQDEAEKSHHSFIGTEHLLLGLLREPDGLAARALSDLGVEIDKVRDAIDSVLGRNEEIRVQQIIPTSRVKKIIEIAFEEAKRMNNTHVGTEHLLLGLLIEGEGIAAHVLENLGVDVEKVRDHLPQQVDEDSIGVRLPIGGAARWGELGYRGRPARESFLPCRRELSTLGCFTSEAMSALALAEEEAVKSAVGYIGTEHLLAGLVRQGEGTAAQVLLAVGVDLARVRQALARTGWTTSRRLAVQSVLPTSGLRKAVNRVAPQEAERGPTERVDTQHLLLAITAEESEPAVQVLVALGVNVAGLRQKLSGVEDAPPP
ncbi:MAG TPA: Clp protease N-terminal domain-containing protein [Candidatus Dormibacteraeota bacterium]|nr:Clp protease N-terminal domain-containing protein [Candidatus Dormibacteraeota bacterium]